MHSVQKFVSGLDLACLILQEERALALYRRYKTAPHKLSRHYRRVFVRLGFFSYRTGSTESILCHDEKKVLKRLLRTHRFSITQLGWIYGACHTYTVPDPLVTHRPAFAWAVFLDQLPKHGVSQQKVATVLGLTRETVNRRLSSYAVQKFVAKRRTYLFSSKPVYTRLWFKTKNGDYARPWNNEYATRTIYTKVHRTFSFEKKVLWKAFQDDVVKTRSSTPYGRRIHQSPPAHGPASWRVLAARTILRTNKVRFRMPVIKRNKKNVRFYDSLALHKEVYRVANGNHTNIGILPCRLVRDESRFATHPFRLRRGPVKLAKRALGRPARGAGPGRPPGTGGGRGITCDVQIHAL